jgi:lysylphosphatidylglycerol synthetase-like protein (DUF2156 family)
MAVAIPTRSRLVEPLAGRRRETASDAARRSEALLRRFGANTTSHQALRGEHQLFFFASPEVDGEESFVAYFDTGAAWVAVGEPIGPRYLAAPAALAFVRAASMEARRAVFVAAEELLPGLRAEPIGLSAEWLAAEWTRTLARAPRLREQLRRARAKKVRVRFVDPDELRRGPLRDAFAALVAQWLDGRRSPPLGFLCRVDPGGLAPDQDLAIAEVDGVLVGAAVLSPIYARKGWLLEHLLRAPKAPNGTSEALIDLVLRTMSERGKAVLSLGTAPLAGEPGLVLRRVRRLLAPFYDFDGLLAFKRRLHPDVFRVTYLLLPEDQSLLLTLWDVLSAFAGGAPLRFALRSIRRKLRRRTRGAVPAAPLLR